MINDVYQNNKSDSKENSNSEVDLNQNNRPHIKFTLKKTPSDKAKYINFRQNNNFYEKKSHMDNSNVSNSTNQNVNNINVFNCGIKNIGNNCYINSILQVFYYFDQFKEEIYLMSKNIKRLLKLFKKDENTDHQSAIEFNKHINEFRSIISLNDFFCNMEEIHKDNIRKKISGSAHPRDLIINFSTIDPKYCLNGQQQDAQEFLIFLLSHIDDTQKKLGKIPLLNDDNDQYERFESNFKEYSKKRNYESINNDTNYNTSNKKRKVDYFIDRLFQGILKSTVQCLECEIKSSRVESFLDLSLNIKGETDLLWSFENFVSVDRLNGREKYNCEECNTRTEAIRFVRIKKLPKILTIHLKRFVYDPKLGVYTKSIDQIDCPLEFSIQKSWLTKKSQDQPNKYSLFAVIFHEGLTSSFGHYSCVVRSRIKKNDREWIYFDDDDVSMITTDELLKKISKSTDSVSTAYILFYVKSQ